MGGVTTEEPRHFIIIYASYPPDFKFARMCRVRVYLLYCMEVAVRLLTDRIARCAACVDQTLSTRHA